MKNVKLFVVLTLMVGLVSSSFASGSRVARMNYQTGATLTGNGIDALENTAKRQPGLRMMLDECLGQNWQGNTGIINHWQVPVGTKFVNSGLDRRGIPCQWEETAKAGTVFVQVMNKVTNKVAIVKNNCLNPVNRVAAVPIVNKQLIETSNSSEVDVDVNVDVTIDFKPVVQATATASTAPIYNIINITTPSAPLMMGGGFSPNQYVVFRDARGFLSLGTTFGGGTKINICNNNVNVNSNSNSNVNNNSNSNSNANTNVVNVGGEPAPDPEPLAVADLDDYIESLFEDDSTNRAREKITA